MRQHCSGELHEEGEDAVDVIRLVDDVSECYMEISGQRKDSRQNFLKLVKAWWNRKSEVDKKTMMK